MRILFWNCKKNVRANDIVSLIISEDIDVAIFAEINREVERDLCNELHSYLPGDEIIGCNKISYIHKKCISSQTIRGQGRYCIFKLNKGNNEYLFGAVHMKDKYSSGDNDRLKDSLMLGDDIRVAEESLRVHNTIIVGDFNCNPWESVMTTKYGLNAVMFKDVIKKHNGSCMYDGMKYEYFYNPMLTIISDNKEPFGSIYNANDSDTIYWNTFDQVLVRPILIERLQQVELIKEYDGRRLLTDYGIPSDKKYSDHLPLIVEVEDKNE